MKPRKTIYTIQREKSQSRKANIDNCEYVIRTIDGNTFYTNSKVVAAHCSLNGHTVFRRITMFDEDI